MADNLELFKKLKTSMRDPEQLLELANETWPELVVEITALAQKIIELNEAFPVEFLRWDLVTQYWPLIVDDIVQSIEQFYEQFQNATDAVDIEDLNNMHRVLSEMCPDLMDHLEVAVFQGWQQTSGLAVEFTEEKAWGVAVEMWRKLATCVGAELTNRGVMGRVTLKELLVVMLRLVPELVCVVQKELGKVEELWAKQQEGSEALNGEMQEGMKGDKAEEMEAEKEKKESERADDVEKCSEAGDASPRT